MLNINLDIANLNNLGEIAYNDNKLTIIKPLGLIADSETNPFLIIKFYSMLKREHLSAAEVAKAVLFLEERVQEKAKQERKVKETLGMGFAIVSEDMFNIAVWDRAYSIVLKNDIYIYRDYEGIGFKSRKLDTQENGSFCAYELGIVNFERERWLEFLASQRTYADKKKYLKTMCRAIEGVDDKGKSFFLDD